jgi:hypothetical protein
MEIPCYKCRQAVEEGVPFCPHCAAPQIRVVVTQPEPVAVGALDAVMSPANPQAAPRPNSVSVLALPLSWTDAIRPCALAALSGTLLMALGLNPLVGMLSAGFLAVVFYRQRRPGSDIRALMGARLGALSGLLGFVMMAILEALAVLTLHKGPEIRKALLDAIAQAGARTADPQVLAVFERFKTPEGLEFLMIVGLIFSFLAAIVLAAIGGALGGAILGRQSKP